MLRALLEQLSGLAAARHLSHIHARKSHEGTRSFVRRRRTHRVSLRADKTGGRHRRIAVNSALLELFDHSLVFFRSFDRCQGHRNNGDTAQIHPFF